MSKAIALDRVLLGVDRKDLVWQLRRDEIEQAGEYIRPVHA